MRVGEVHAIHAAVGEGGVDPGLRDDVLTAWGVGERGAGAQGRT